MPFAACLELRLLGLAGNLADAVLGGYRRDGPKRERTKRIRMRRLRPRALWRRAVRTLQLLHVALLAVARGHARRQRREQVVGLAHLLGLGVKGGFVRGKVGLRTHAADPKTT